MSFPYKFSTICKDERITATAFQCAEHTGVDNSCSVLAMNVNAKEGLTFKYWLRHLLLYNRIIGYFPMYSGASGGNETLAS